MLGIGALANYVGGSVTLLNGLAVTPTAPASLSVIIGPGQITTNATVDATAYGTLAADTAHTTVKIGQNLDPTTLAIAAPSSPGTSITYLLEASLSETDAVPVGIFYFNAANPSAPFLGVNGSGILQPTRRQTKVALQAKAGTAAATGSQIAPTADAGWTGFATVTVAFGATSVTTGNIAVLPTAPYVPYKLGPGLVPGTSNMVSYLTTGTFVVPAGIIRIHVRLWGGGGGAGGSAPGTGAAGGGAGGGYSEGFFAVTPGQIYTVTVGAAGPAGNPGVNGSAGGTSSVSGLCSATGGFPGLGCAAGAVGSGGITPGAGSGGQLNVSAGNGLTGALQGGLSFGGAGGWSPFGASVTPGVNGTGGFPGNSAAFPGGGGSGGINGGNGGSAGAGLVIIEW